MKETYRHRITGGISPRNNERLRLGDKISLISY